MGGASEDDLPRAKDYLEGLAIRGGRDAGMSGASSRALSP
jgi:hypothetical protein